MSCLVGSRVVICDKINSEQGTCSIHLKVLKSSHVVQTLMSLQTRRGASPKFLNSIFTTPSWMLELFAMIFI